MLDQLVTELTLKPNLLEMIPMPDHQLDAELKKILEFEPANAHKTLELMANQLVGEMIEAQGSLSEDGTEMKPSQIYRKYAPLARRLANLGHMTEELGGLVVDLMLDATLPMSELDNPTWVDGYTGEVDEKEDFVNFSPKNLTEEEKAAWGASGGFNDEEMLPGFLVNEQPADIREKEFAQDVQPDWTKAGKIARSLEEHYSMLEKSILGSVVPISFTRHHETFSEKVASPNFLERLSDDEKKAKNKSWGILKNNPMLECALALEQFPDEFGDIVAPRGLKLWIANNENWLDTIERPDGIRWSKNVKRYAGEASVTPAVRRFSAATVTQVLQQFPEDAKDVKLTRPYIQGWLNCMLNSDKILDEHGHSIANEAGWMAYMQNKSPEAAAVYRKVIADTGDRSKAWKAFVDASKPKDTFKVPFSGDERGAVLITKSGADRFVSWKIMAMKFKANEIELTQERRALLKAFLEKKGWGEPVLSVL